MTNKKSVFKVLCIFGVVLVAIAALGAWVLWGWMIGPAELAARCDDVTVWRRNPGAFSSYRYEIRDKTRTIKTRLTFKELDDYIDTSHCLFLGGG